MKESLRRLLLGACLIATLLAAWSVPGEDASDVVVTARSAGRPAALAESTRPAGAVFVASQITAGRRRPADEVPLTLFDVAAWHAPAATAPPPAAAAAPAVVAAEPVTSGAPTLPFRPLGRYDDAQGAVIFLLYRDQNLIVRRGEVFADHYRIDAIEGTSVSIRHLPSDQLQSLDMAGGG